MEAILPKNPLEAIYAIIGIAGVLSLFFSRRRKDADATEERVIKLLKDQTEIQDSKIKEFDERQRTNKAEIDHLRGENKVMGDILRGRDGSTLEYQKRGLEAMERIQLVEVVVKSTDVKVNKLVELLERHMANIEKKMT